MRRFTKLFLFVILVALITPAYAQKQLFIGKINDVVAAYKKKARAINTSISPDVLVTHSLSNKQRLTLKLKSSKKKGISQFFFGEVQNIPYSNFYLEITGSKASGSIIMREQKKFYRYSSTSDGSVYLTEEDIDKVLCIGFEKKLKPTLGKIAQTGNVAVSPPVLQSYPGAEAVLYLDFDGQLVTNTVWNSAFNSGNPIVAEPAALTEIEMTEVWKLVSEDYRPFGLNVTTSEAVFNNAPSNRRMRVIFTPTNYFFPGYGGVAYIGSFTWGGGANGEAPCWVWNTTSKYAGEAGSHEAGHTLQLAHDGRTTPSEAYFYGQNSWAPIMGAGYYKSVVQWSKGEYPYADNTEDDLDKISTLNGFSYRKDDHGNSISTATPLVVDGSGSVSAANNKGIITTQTDKDLFSFSTGGGTLALSVNPNPGYPNLDVLLTLRNAANAIIATADPDTQDASFTNISLTPGTYYLTVDGTAGSLGANSDYASLGEYSISGTIPNPIGALNNAPTVKIASPGNNAIYNAPANITINATAADADGSISFVRFYNGGTLLKTDSVSPYSYTAKNVAAGHYSFVAKATDNKGSTSSSASRGVTVLVTNKAPVVIISSPANNAVYSAPATINLAALATDADGKITKVQFYRGGTLLKTDSTSPYTYTLSNVAAGNYTLTAKATDNKGLFSSSSSITVAVSAAINNAPTVKITSPVNNAIYNAPANITINATAADADGSISFVRFYNGGTLLKTDSVSPYSYTAKNVAAGHYSFVAKATDNKGSTSSSASSGVTVLVTNKAPVVIISSPANNAVYSAPATINLAALATDADGKITKVQFYRGGTLLKTDSTSPYTYTLNNVAAGNYTLTAKATDNKGLFSSSSSISIAVSAAPNRVPIVKIISPSNETIYNAPANITINATATDADGTVSSVKFYNGSTYLKTVFSSPYTYTLSNLPAGNYSLTAKVTDNKGAQTISDAIVVKVSDAPIVSNKPTNVNNKPFANNTAHLNIYPNPVSNIVNISFTGLKPDEPITILVVSESGAVLKAVRSKGSFKTVRLDMSSLMNGIYVVKLISGGKVLSKQFIKL